MKQQIIKNYKVMHLFNYSIGHLPNKDKIRFYYALKGRDGRSGVIKLTKSRHLSRSVLLVPDKHHNHIEEFLGYWDCGYIAKRIYVKV